MRVLILGAGALGSLLGARLSQTQAKVLLLSTNREHVEAIQKHGLVVEELDGSLSRYFPPSCHDPGLIREKMDWVLVTVKSYDTEEAVAGVRACCHSSTIFLTLQNGIGNWERIADLVGEESTLVGTTAQGATLVEPGRIRHGGNGLTYVGEFSRPLSPRVHSIVQLFCDARVEARASTQMQQLVWEKLLVNVGINAITALTGITNGVIASLKTARELSTAAVQEALQVARSKGMDVGDGIVDRVLAVAQATSRNRSSMGQDVDRKRQTEIDAINGAIVRFGEEMCIPTPINRTLTQLIKIVEAAYTEIQH